LESELLRRHATEVQRKNTELDEARLRAERALSLAEEKIRIRSEFVLMINHELRTPLTSVVTGAELLRSNEMEESERMAILEMMTSDGSRLLGIIDQILSVARIENNGLSKDLAVIPIGELCTALSAEFVESTDTAVIAAKTDLNALLMVVRSLADNARIHGSSEVKVQCSTKPTIEPDLLVGSRPTAAVFISVMDDGPGIDRDFLPRIFEKFEKSSFSSGTGLGLYMTKVIMEALEGSVAVQTSKDGTTFELAIPAVRAPTLAGVRA
jgi:signal transduction histidine kinase